MDNSRIASTDHAREPIAAYRAVWPFAAIAILLAAGVLPLPLSYYGFLRLMVVGASIYGLASGLTPHWSPRLIVFGPPLVLWGFVRGLERDVWVPLDLTGALVFSLAAATYRIGDYRRHRKRLGPSPVRPSYSAATALLAVACVLLSIGLMTAHRSSKPSGQRVALADDPGAHRQGSVSANCVTSTSEDLTLVGTLERRTYPGRPGYENVEAGDEPETGFYLALLNPICFSGALVEGREALPSFPVWDVQLLLDSVGYSRLRDSLTMVIHVRGKLLGAFTGHHHAPVLMDVDLGSATDRNRRQKRH